MGEREQVRPNAESAEKNEGRKAESGRAESGEAEGENPVAAGLSYVDYAHLGGDAAVEGHTSASTFGGLMEEMGESASATFAGEETAAHTGLMAGTAIASPLSIAGGIMDLVEAKKQWATGDHGTAADTGFEGGLSIVSGGAGLAGLAGVGAAATAAPLLGAGALGMKVGHFGDGEVKKHDWLHDDEGNAESASSWAADRGVHAEEWVSKHFGNKAGSVAGGAVSILSSIPAGFIAAGGAGAAIGDKFAHADRARAYASPVEMDGIDQLNGAAKGTPEAWAAANAMADYDDGAEVAIARSKAEHPERWGGAPANGPTYIDAIQAMSKNVHDTVYKKPT